MTNNTEIQPFSFLSSNWGNLSWTPWCSFTEPNSFRQLPATAGLYRVRAVHGQELFYIGETGRDVRARLGDLRRNTMKETMPFNDPHTAAPSLWAWRDAENIEFECSAALFIPIAEKEEARRIREGLEFYLLWQYRLEFGFSTRCNHGRFHPRYKKSTDRQKGFRGHRLPDDVKDILAGGPSLPPLQQQGRPHETNWMGLNWSPLQRLDTPTTRLLVNTPGVYKIIDGENELIYIGETNNLRNRLLDHAKKPWGGTPVSFSYVDLPHITASYQRHEIENDLIASFYAERGRTPIYQLANHR